MPGNEEESNTNPALLINMISELGDGVGVPVLCVQWDSIPFCPIYISITCLPELPEASSMTSQMRTAAAACQDSSKPLHGSHLRILGHVWGNCYLDHKIPEFDHQLKPWGGWMIPLAQESNNNLAPLTVKLGNYSHWNRSRDFTKNVKLPLEPGIRGPWLFGYPLLAPQKMIKPRTNRTWSIGIFSSIWILGGAVPIQAEITLISKLKGSQS